MNPLCPTVLQSLQGGVRGRGEPKNLRGASGLDPPPSQLQHPLPPQLFLCCLLNLQESGLLCEVRRDLGRGTVPGPGDSGRA